MRVSLPYRRDLFSLGALTACLPVPTGPLLLQVHFHQERCPHTGSWPTRPPSGNIQSTEGLVPKLKGRIARTHHSQERVKGPALSPLSAAKLLLIFPGVSLRWGWFQANGPMEVEFTGQEKNQMIIPKRSSGNWHLGCICCQGKGTQAMLGISPPLSVRSGCG